MDVKLKKPKLNNFRKTIKFFNKLKTSFFNFTAGGILNYTYNDSHRMGIWFVIY